jgi:hypothetical protein
MLPTFVIWSGIFIVTTEPVQRVLFGFVPSVPGETFYLEAWGPWIAFTVLWLGPIVTWLAMSSIALRLGAGRSAVFSLAIHSGLFLFFTVPNIIERLIVL